MDSPQEGSVCSGELSGFKLKYDILSLKPQGGNLLWTQRITEGMPYLTLWGSPNGVRLPRSMLVHSGEADKGTTGSGNVHRNRQETLQRLV